MDRELRPGCGDDDSETRGSTALSGENTRSQRPQPMTDNEEFDAMMEAAFAEPLMITGAIGNDELTEVAPTPERVGVDLGVAGSLLQTGDRLAAQRRAARGPFLRDRVSLGGGMVLVVCAVALGVIAGGGRIPGPAVVTGVVGLATVAGLSVAVWFLMVRYGASTAERSLRAAAVAEQRAGHDLAAALAGSSWVLLHDRRLPNSEHRVPFIAVGPAGVALVSVLPAGPYLILAPGGVKAGDDELAYGWLPARIWEARYLMRQLSNLGTSGLRFTGPVMPMAMEGYPPATKIPAGWSAQPPYRIDQFPIRRPAVLGQYLNYLPRIFAPHHVAQLAQLVDQHCPPAPTPTT